MSVNALKKTILASSLVVLAISANAQDRDENHSVVATKLSAHTVEMRLGEAAQEITPPMGLANVALDQLVTKPLQGLLSTAEAFCKFSYQHPVAAFTLTAAYALPVVATLVSAPTPSPISGNWTGNWCLQTPGTGTIGKCSAWQNGAQQTYAIIPQESCSAGTEMNGNVTFSTLGDCEVACGGTPPPSVFHLALYTSTNDWNAPYCTQQVSHD